MPICPIKYCPFVTKNFISRIIAQKKIFITRIIAQKFHCKNYCPKKRDIVQLTHLFQKKYCPVTRLPKRYRRCRKNHYKDIAHKKIITRILVEKRLIWTRENFHRKNFLHTMGYKYYRQNGSQRKFVQLEKFSMEKISQGYKEFFVYLLQNNYS